MPSKNTAGGYYHRYCQREDRIIDKIDNRDLKGENSENVDNVYRNYRLTEDGSQVWSF